MNWGTELRSFRPRLSATSQVDSVHGAWLGSRCQTGHRGHGAPPQGLPQVGNAETGGEAANKAFGAAKMVVVDHPVQSQSEADALAASVCDSIGGHYLEAEGLCYGIPRLQPGSRVQIDNIGQRFSGTYYVTATTHNYSPAEGYSTLISVSGKQPNTVLSTLEGAKG